MVGKVIDDVYTPIKKGYTLKKGRERMLRKQLKEFDDAFPDGVFAFPPKPEEPRVKIRALGEYCKQQNVLPEDLSKEEMAQFLVYE